jgi:hypothetical protein
MAAPDKGAEACKAGDMKLITPNMPEKSLVLQKVEEDETNRTCGARMPSKCTDSMCLDTKSIDLIRSWIMAGAPKG